jgi:hypothetical protein
MRLRFVFIFLIAVSVQAAPMFRVVKVVDPATIIVEREGVRSEVRLAGIEITDRNNAFASLSWTLASSWVMIEDGRVYRSPDALFVNEELVRKGFARWSESAVPSPRVATVYLGELDLGLRPKDEKSAKPAGTATRPERRTRAARPLRARLRATPGRKAPAPLP